MSVSGGVAINSWAFADKAKTSDKVAAVRKKAAFADTPAGGRISFCCGKPSVAFRSAKVAIESTLLSRSERRRSGQPALSATETN